MYQNNHPHDERYALDAKESAAVNVYKRAALIRSGTRVLVSFFTTALSLSIAISTVWSSQTNGARFKRALGTFAGLTIVFLALHALAWVYSIAVRCRFAHIFRKKKVKAYLAISVTSFPPLDEAEHGLPRGASYGNTCKYHMNKWLTRLLVLFVIVVNIGAAIGACVVAFMLYSRYSDGIIGFGVKKDRAVVGIFATLAAWIVLSELYISAIYKSGFLAEETRDVVTDDIDV